MRTQNVCYMQKDEGLWHTCQDCNKKFCKWCFDRANHYIVCDTHQLCIYCNKFRKTSTFDVMPTCPGSAKNSFTSKPEALNELYLPHSDLFQGWCLDPECGCQEEQVDEIVAELFKARMKERGDTGQIRRADVVLEEVRALQEDVHEMKQCVKRIM